jgi:peptidoglycan-associated lipoprotein
MLLFAVLVAASFTGCGCLCHLKIGKTAETAAEGPQGPPPGGAAPGAPAQAAPGTAAGALQQQAEDSLQNIYFDFDKSDIRPEAETRLTIIGKFLLAHPDLRILIAGNCDERGSEAYNMALGQRRAEAARSVLVSYGVTVQRLDVVSYGKDRLAVPNCTDEACHAKNRRDEFTIITK